MTRRDDRSGRDLARFFRAPSSDRVERGWRNVASRLRGQRRAPRPYGAMAFAVLLVAIVLMVKPWSKSPGIEGTVLETNDQSETLTLPEGSSVVVGPASRLLLVNVSADRVRLDLQRGTIDVVATHRAGRSFTVVARQLDVDVVGTRFHVDVGDAAPNADIAVSEGRVRVTSRDDPQHPRFLSAGESWSARAVPQAPLPSASAIAVVHGSDAGAAHVATPRPGLSPAFTSLYRAGRYVDAYALVSDDFATRCATLDADALFALAETARLSGHARDAATAFDALRTRFRSNPRAPLAALELGRLELDELDEPRAAKAALDDAVSLQPDAFFREDADARRVQALEEMADRVSCAAERDRYLSTYPQGVHRATVARRCR